MKFLIAFLFLIASVQSFAVCSTVLSRNNYTTNQILTSSALNTDFNQLVTKTNEIDGDCITDATLPKAKLEAGAFNETVTAVSATYSVLTTDQVVTGSAGSAFTMTLPTASGVTGKTYTIKKIDSSLNAVTIDGLSSETIDGALTKTLATQYEAIKIISNGTNWIIIERVIPVLRTAYTPTFTGLGTVTLASFYWTRVGDSMEINGTVTSGTVNGAELVSLTVPTGYTINSSKVTIANNTSNPGMLIGEFVQSATANIAGPIVTATGTSSTLVYVCAAYNAAGKLTPQLGGNNTGSNQPMSFKFKVPITGWEQ